MYVRYVLLLSWRIPSAHTAHRHTLGLGPQEDAGSDLVLEREQEPSKTVVARLDHGKVCPPTTTTLQPPHKRLSRALAVCPSIPAKPALQPLSRAIAFLAPSHASASACPVCVGRQRADHSARLYFSPQVAVFPPRTAARAVGSDRVRGPRAR